MGGGTDGKSVVYNIMSFDARNIDANDKEN
jgi:hypothetical protein